MFKNNLVKKIFSKFKPKKGDNFDIYQYVRYKLNIYLDVNSSLNKWSNCDTRTNQFIN